MTKVIVPVLVLVALGANAQAEGDATRGAQAYRACAACHSLHPDRNMTGPSLAGVWHRKAGSLASFRRYSPALKEADIVWDERTLDPWLANPAHFLPGNRMTFPGIKDEQARADLIAYLKSVPASGAAEAGAPGRQMGGMMGARPAPNLKKLDPEDRVEAITYCRDTYRVRTADGKTQEFWERNLRLKTDSSDEGPRQGVPAIVAAGMMGDRASLIFATPEEISASIKQQCQ
jgi:cytochrome c